jgi:hypothetical protein
MDGDGDEVFIFWWCGFGVGRKFLVRWQLNLGKILYKIIRYRILKREWSSELRLIRE